MPRRKKSETEVGFKIQQMSLEEAKRVFNRKRSRGSKYDEILAAAEKLERGDALIIEQVGPSEVTGVRQKLVNILGEGFKTEATKTDREKNLYDLLVYRE